MTPSEVNVLIEASAPQKIGSLSREDYDRLLDRRAELEAQGVEVL